MTSDNVKSVLMIGAALGVTLIALKIKSTADKLGRSFSDATDIVTKQIADGAKAAADKIGETVTEVKATAKQAAVDVGLSKPDGWVSELPLSQWPAKVKEFVIAMQRMRGRAGGQIVPADYAGWKYYSNGTLTSPAMEYFTAEEIKNGSSMAFHPIWWNGKTDWNIADISYPKVGGDLNDVVFYADGYASDNPFLEA